MKFLASVFTFLLFLHVNPAQAQMLTLSGSVADKENGLTLAGAQVTVQGDNFLAISQVNTDLKGNFSLELNNLEWYYVFVSCPGYKTYSERIFLEGKSLEMKFSLTKKQALTTPHSEVINNDTAPQKTDLFHIGFGSQFYSPDLGAFKSSYTFDYVYGFRWKLSNINELGLDIQSLQLSWSNLNKDTFLTADILNKEQYFGVYMGIWLYNRFTFTHHKTKPHRPGLFLDAGLGYTLPLYYAYSYKTDDYTQTNVRHIHKTNEFAGMLRLGYDFVAIKATYRLTDILVTPYPEPPKLKMGIEFLIPIGLPE